VTLHVKGEPTYISDATEKDVYEHIQEMARSSHPEIIRSLSKRLKFYLDQKKFQIRPDIFWNTYAFYWEFPSVIEDFIKTTALVIIKGDANYRRLLGDRLWPATTNVEQAISFFPTSFVSLRTLKSNPIVGLTAQMEKQLEQEDPHWRINGKRGIIQSVLKKEYINTKQE
jgi:hypothetical protein